MGQREFLIRPIHKDVRENFKIGLLTMAPAIITSVQWHVIWIEYKYTLTYLSSELNTNTYWHIYHLYWIQIYTDISTTCTEYKYILTYLPPVLNTGIHWHIYHLNSIQVYTDISSKQAPIISKSKSQLPVQCTDRYFIKVPNCLPYATNYVETTSIFDIASATKRSVGFLWKFGTGVLSKNLSSKSKFRKIWSRKNHNFYGRKENRI